jgi:hypothetical protein
MLQYTTCHRIYLTQEFRAESCSGPLWPLWVVDGCLYDKAWDIGGRSEMMETA